MKHKTHNQKTFHVSRFTFQERGFTLIEMLVYMVLVAAIAGVLTISIANNLKAYNRSEALQNISGNVNDALRLITDEIKYAKGIYTPTSLFGAANGQLSLETALNTPAGENSTYVDYYVDGGRIYEKRESQTASALTSDRVFVSSLLFTDAVATTTKDAITVQIQARINTASQSLQERASTMVQSTATLRGAY